MIDKFVDYDGLLNTLELATWVLEKKRKALAVKDNQVRWLIIKAYPEQDGQERDLW